MDNKAWFSAWKGRRVTDAEVADLLGTTRKTANKRLNGDLSADDVITISRGLGINPTIALSDLGFLTLDEIYGFLDSDGTLLESASPEQLVRALAESFLRPIEIVEMGARAKAQMDHWMSSPTAPPKSPDTGRLDETPRRAERDHADRGSETSTSEDPYALTDYLRLVADSDNEPLGDDHDYIP